MQTKEVKLIVCKETTEVFEAFAKAVKEAKKLKKEGKSSMEISAGVAAACFPDLMKAIEGASEIGEELKSAQLEETAGYGGAIVIDALRS